MPFSLPSLSILLVCITTAFGSGDIVDKRAGAQQWQQQSVKFDLVKSAMLASIRTSWEQGTATQGIIDYTDSHYSVFSPSPFKAGGPVPTDALQLALSAVVRQTPDGRLSQNINDGLDMAALDGASAGPAVLLGALVPNAYSSSYWETAADRELAWIMSVGRTSNGAISMRADTLQYWADGVFMGPPFLAYYGAVKGNQSLLQLAYDNCRLYREVLLIDGPTGPLWAHIYDDNNKTWIDEGIWGTGNAWAAQGMLRVAATISKSSFAVNMSAQVSDLTSWTKQILDGVFPALNNDSLVPDYILGGPNFSDCSSSSALAAVAYRGATLYPKVFTSNYTKIAGKIRVAVTNNINSMGLLTPVVNPLIWNATGVVSTEGQSFGLMMFAAWRDWSDQ